METITVELKAKMATGEQVVYSLCRVFSRNTEKNRCKLLQSAYEVAASKGINVAACHHGFKVS